MADGRQTPRRSHVTLREGGAIAACLGIEWALLQVPPEITAAVAPLILGGFIAISIRMTGTAFAVGTVAAYFFSGIALVGLMPVGALILHCMGAGVSKEELSILVLGCVGGASMFGGIVGARIDGLMLDWGTRLASRRNDSAAERLDQTAQHSQ